MYRFSLGGDIITDNKEDITTALREIADLMEQGISRDFLPGGLWGDEWTLDEDYEYDATDAETDDQEDY